MLQLAHLLLSAALLTGGVGQGHARGARDIRRVDFRNFAFKASGESVRLHRGRGTYRENGDETFSYTVERVSVVYGDLTGDGRDEAALTIRYNGGGTGAFSKGFVFTLRRGRPVLLVSFEGGDRADGGINEVRIRGGLLNVQRNEPERINGVPAGLCCPMYWVTTRYRWDGARLLQVGEPEKVEPSLPE
jgi:hypothetical protein